MAATMRSAGSSFSDFTPPASLNNGLLVAAAINVDPGAACGFIGPLIVTALAVMLTTLAANRLPASRAMASAGVR